MMEKYINADKLLEYSSYYFIPFGSKPKTDSEISAYKLGWNEALQAVHNMVPTADVQEIVRCKDCKWSDKFSDMTAEPHMPLKCIGIRYGGVCENWFCEHGERRE